MREAKSQPGLADKISDLRRCMEDFPNDPATRIIRDQLVALLTSANRYEEALQVYRIQLALRKPSSEPDLKYLGLLLKTGRFSDVIRLTAQSPQSSHDFQFNIGLCEYRVQALLAQGRYRMARQTLDQWLGMHEREGLESNRFAADVQNLQRLRRSLFSLEQSQGPVSKALFTASVPDSLNHWSRRPVPIVFFKLVPADAASQLPGVSALDPQTNQSYRHLVEDMNRGFRYLSGNAFSLNYRDAHTLYIKTSDLDLSGTYTNLLLSRVYVHSILPLYRRAGKAFVILVDYRAQSNEEAAYMGDGLIHIAANKLHTVTLMHEILHGLGATHQEWNSLTGEGYQFDPEDRGLMSFEKGELRYLGLEEKNRVLLDWPRVATLHLDNETTDLSKLNLSPTFAARSSNLPPSF